MSTVKSQVYEKIKELFATVGFIIVFLAILLIVGYAISSITSRSQPPNIKTEKECKDKGHAWHSVDGCMSHDVYIERYVDH